EAGGSAYHAIRWGRRPPLCYAGPRMFRCTAAALAFVLVLRAQQPDAPSPENTVFSVTTTLVQVDAVVTDSKGRQVTTLKPEDFEVLLDRKAQRITNFSYVHLDSPDV